MNIDFTVKLSASEYTVFRRALLVLLDEDNFILKSSNFALSDCYPGSDNYFYHSNVISDTDYELSILQSMIDSL